MRGKVGVGVGKKPLLVRDPVLLGQEAAKAGWVRTHRVFLAVSAREEFGLHRKCGWRIDGRLGFELCRVSITLPQIAIFN